MTVPSTPSRNDYIGTGLLDAYDFSFRITSEADLLVTKQDTLGVDTTLAYPADYTVSGVGDFPGGTITLTAGNLPVGYLLSIRDAPALVQTSDIRNQGDFFPEIHEDALDYLTRIVKSQQDILDRSVRLSETSTGVSPTLPAPEAGYSIVWNADADGLENAIPAGAPVSVFMATVLDDANAAAARATLDVPSNAEMAAADTAAVALAGTNALAAALGFGFRNRLINGAMQISQRATSATVTAGTAVPTVSTGYPCVDRWYVYSTGANVTAAQIAGSGPVLNRLQITGAASVTAVGIGQRIEAQNSADLAGSTATLSVDIANSLLTSVTWSAYYANTADAFGTVGTPTKTLIATGTFAVNSSVSRYSAAIAVPSAATTGIEIVLTVGAQISGTWVIGNVQLSTGTLAVFDPRPGTTEMLLCRRYLPAFIPTGSGNSYVGVGQCVFAVGGTAARIQHQFMVPARTAPTGIVTATANLFSAVNSAGAIVCTSVVFAVGGLSSCRIEFNVAAGLTPGQGAEGLAGTNAFILFTGCEIP